MGYTKKGLSMIFILILWLEPPQNKWLQKVVAIGFTIVKPLKPFQQNLETIGFGSSHEFWSFLERGNNSVKKLTIENTIIQFRVFKFQNNFNKIFHKQRKERFTVSFTCNWNKTNLWVYLSELNLENVDYE
jgi:hypothetical protein